MSDAPTLPRGDWVRTVLLYVVAGAVVYFGNVQVQSCLGERALTRTGLSSVPLDEALLRAVAQDKNVLVEVAAIWCPSCRRLDNNVLSRDAVKNAVNAHYVFSRLEYESQEAEAFMEKYNVYGYPTLVVLGPDGELLRRLPLTFDPDTFVGLIGY